MLNPLRATLDYLRGTDLKTRLPEPPAAPPTEVKLFFTTDSYNGALADALYPTVSQALGGYRYDLNSAVFACLKVIAYSFQEAPLRAYRKLPDGTDEWLDEAPVMALLADPHPSLSEPEFNWWLVYCLNVDGNAYLRKVRSVAGGVVQLWPISPTKMWPETDDDAPGGTFISRYVYDDGAGHREEIPVEDVVHFRLGVDDTDHRRGLSPLKRLVRELLSDDEATRFGEYLFKNFGVASLVVTTPDRTLTKEQAEELKRGVVDRFTGANRGSVGVLNNGATVQQLGYNPDQLDLKGAHQFPESRIAAVLGVPAVLVGFSLGLEHSIYNNMEQSQEHLFEQTIVPLWRQVAATYTKQLLRPDFDADPAVRLRYDLHDVRALQEDVNEVFTRVSLAVDKGWMTKDEARAEMGLEPLPNGLGEAEAPAPVPAAFRPGGQPPDQATAQQAQQAAMRRLLGEQKARALNAIPGLADTLLALSTPGLQADLEAFFAEQQAAVTQAVLREG